MLKEFWDLNPHCVKVLVCALFYYISELLSVSSCEMHLSQSVLND